MTTSLLRSLVACRLSLVACRFRADGTCAGCLGATRLRIRGPPIAGLIDAVTRAGRAPSLSPRQIEVLHGRARGETFAAIGRRLNISPRTAEEYVTDVMHKVVGTFATTTPTDLERQLGLSPGDLMT